MRVLGVDIGKSWATTGVASIEFDEAGQRVVAVTPGCLSWPAQPISPNAFATAIDAFVRAQGIRAVALDGPQGWRDPATPTGSPGVGRRCESACRTQAKTGVFPKTYPGNQREWVEHSVETFAALLALPGVVLADNSNFTLPATGYAVLECFPTSAWRSSGITALPSKRRAPALAPFINALRTAYDLPAFMTASHDDLQAVVAALTAVGCVGGAASAIPRGVPSVDVHGRRAEGFIWDCAPRGGPVSIKIAPQRAAQSSSSTKSTPARVPSARVSSKVLAQVNKVGESQMLIALSSCPSGTKDAPVVLQLIVDDEEYSLVVGDTGAAWRSHQNEATAADFERLFAMLADTPDARVPIADVRAL